MFSLKGCQNAFFNRLPNPECRKLLFAAGSVTTSHQPAHSKTTLNGIKPNNLHQHRFNTTLKICLFNTMPPFTLICLLCVVAACICIQMAQFQEYSLEAVSSCVPKCPKCHVFRTPYTVKGATVTHKT